MGNHIGERAVVLGGSIAGMLAAVPLSQAYREVILIDRDDLTEPEPDRPAGVLTVRRAVPHGWQLQALLAKGQRVLEELFPGMTDELVSFGASRGDFNKNVRWYFDGRKIKQVRSDMIAVGPGRPLLENRIRARISALPNVSFRQHTDILGIVATPDRKRILGARIQSQQPGAEPETLLGDLVLDATGRGSRTPRWLTELGYPEVEEERVKMGLAYSTGNFLIDREDDLLGEDVASVPIGTPNLPRGAVYARMAGYHSITLTGLLGQKPPTDRAGFLAYAESLAIPDIAEVVRRAEFIHDPVPYNFPESRRRRFDKMASLPENYLIMGDAACIFNPIYAQGMTVAAVEATVLRDHLSHGKTPDPLKFQRDVVKRGTAIAWDVAGAGDFTHRGVTGNKGVKFAVGGWFVQKVTAAAEFDDKLSTAFMRTAGLIAPPTSLMRPDLMARALFGKKSAPVPDPGYTPVRTAKVADIADASDAARRTLRSDLRKAR
ncbi:monooxygenase, FAD-binding [Catenulispora acidiphila DSM 44928]|uniref:Monooxygenase, FAD-binding n=1 Tax=Catenulispora acidiphila (strain DSM 44928 / JCM 14897 / NBRC 102108 / NRRL B-24433 / ID139908) TaxID=479433 RepID=C7Q9T0_CATAD|nr:FAD-binding monooxygenase [Catenulispora acidiphila]ACU76249.1 monooxygenase, FAD-binding [Catenulispora acidiphila DSM 44928]